MIEKTEPVRKVASERVIAPASADGSAVGFRVASPVPTPQVVPYLQPLGVVVLWGLMGLAGWRKLHPQPEES